MNPYEDRDFLALEIVNARLQLSVNTGAWQPTRSPVGKRVVNNGVKHFVWISLNQTKLSVKLDSEPYIHVTWTISNRFTGPLFVGGVEVWTPEIKSDTLCDSTFYGCFEVSEFDALLQALLCTATKQKQ